MIERVLSIEIAKDLVYPKKEATVHVHEEHMYALEYSISAPEGTEFKIYLDGELLLDDTVGDTGICRGSTVI